jgi:hypothetical protein
MNGLGSAPLSRVFAIASIGTSVLLQFRVLDTFQLYFNKRLILDKYEFWRPFTSIFCFGPLDITACLHIFMLINFSVRVEGKFFGERPADFLLFSFFGWMLMWFFAAFHPLLFLGGAFSSYVLYYWAKRSPDDRMGLLGMQLALPAPWFPIVLVLSDFGPGWKGLLADLIGFALAHVYFVLRDVFAIKYNFRLLFLPDWINERLNRILS